MKVDGEVTPLTQQSLTPLHSRELARAIMTDKQAAEFEATSECNFAISPTGIGRFRVNAFVQQGRVVLVLRTVPAAIPKLDELRLPAALKDVAMVKRGLVIFAGRHGLGQVDLARRDDRAPQPQQQGHVITIEDPIEFVHDTRAASCTSAKSGVDTENCSRRSRTRCARRPT